MSIADVIKRRRKDLGITLKQIANKVGVSEATVQRWETGAIPNIRFSRIEKLAAALQISIEELMGVEPLRKSYRKVLLINSFDDAQDQFRDLGIEYIELAKNIKQSGLTPEEVMEVVNAVKKIKGTKVK